MWTILKPLIGPALDKALDLIPNKNERNRAREGLDRSLLEAVTNASALQARINLEEAKHPSVFVSGWRPFIGWCCGAGIAWSFIVLPVLSWLIAVYGDPSIRIPEIDTGALYQLVLAMLGMGGLRALEKLKGKARVN